jgi:putative transposase
MSQKLRMDGRDYSRPGWYFVTLGADDHKHLFGAIAGCEMRANALGRLVERCWAEIPAHYAHIELGAWQLMPNHFHGLVRITHAGGKGLGEVMNVFKGAVTREWRRQGAAAPSEVSRYSEKERAQAKVWAPNYYDVICFDAEELDVRERYIRANPKRWALRDVPQGAVRKSRYRGNVALLKHPGPRRALRVSRRATDAQVAALQAELAAFDGLVCSTFFSPGERACRDALLSGPARIRMGVTDGNAGHHSREVDRRLCRWARPVALRVSGRPCRGHARELPAGEPLGAAILRICLIGRTRQDAPQATNWESVSRTTPERRRGCLNR